MRNFGLQRLSNWKGLEAWVGVAVADSDPLLYLYLCSSLATVKAMSVGVDQRKETSLVEYSDPLLYLYLCSSLAIVKVIRRSVGVDQRKETSLVEYR